VGGEKGGAWGWWGERVFGGGGGGLGEGGGGGGGGGVWGGMGMVTWHGLPVW